LASEPGFFPSAAGNAAPLQKLAFQETNRRVEFERVATLAIFLNIRIATRLGEPFVSHTNHSAGRR